MSLGSGLTSVRRISILCATACCGLAIAIPVFTAYAWLFASPESLAETFHAPRPSSGMLLPWQRALALVANLPSALLFGFGLWRACGCLFAVSRGEFFESAAVDGLRDFARAAFWAVVIGFAEDSVTSVIISWTNAPSTRVLTFGIHSQQVFLALYAGIFWVVASAMARAAALARENQQFV